MEKTEISNELFPNLRQQIIEAYHSGMYYNAIIKQFEIPYTKLLSILREEGLLNESGRKSLIKKNFQERMATILKLHQRGKNMLSIAKSLGIDNGLVTYALKKAGVYKKQKFVANRLTKAEREIRNQQIVEMYKQGTKIKVIAKLFQRGTTVIVDILQKSGLQAKKYSRLNEDDYHARTKKICELYSNGTAMNAISRMIGISQPRVSQVLKQAGLHNNREMPTGYLTRQERKNRDEQIYDLYRNGKTIEEIAAVFKRDKTQIYLILKKAGLSQAAVILNKQKREEHHLLVCNLYKQGLRITDIAKQLNAAKSSVRAILKRAQLR